MKYLRNNKGITLAVLVVTIIVLLILSGVTISMITGGDGVIDKAANAKEEHEISEEKEKISIAAAQAIGENRYGDLVQENFQSMLDNQTGMKFEVYNSNGSFTVRDDKDRIFIVNENGEITDLYKNPALNYKIYGSGSRLPSEYQEIYFIKKEERTRELDRS